MKKLKYNLIGISGNLGNGKDFVGSIINFLSSGMYGDYTSSDFESYISENHPFPTYTIKKYADALKDICCIILGCTREQLEDREYKETPIPHLTKYVVEYYTRIMGDKPYTRNVFPDLVSAQNEIDKHNPNSGFTCKLNIIHTTPRDIQNSFGTDCGRDMIHPNIWCEALFSKYKGHGLKKYEGTNIFEAYFHKNCRYCDKSYTGYKRQTYCNNCADEKGLIYPNWLITDVRFPDNEGKYIKERGGIVIGIKRKFSLRFPEYAHLEMESDPYGVPKALEKVDPILYKRITSSSEVSMGDFSWCDHIIENNGSVEELIEKIKEIIWI